ncbi:lysophospholipid acyltransferase family protein [Palleronia sp. LCG004]|uniref:lysophospholipid acyltransferase family protein n=1 Tax=Palleronia sp. LCG004 TaxID=3079304 RepID=UPI0029424F21|nr:lysophospholipid acyltransferase family protein [Palleronia sp. LCG004]WOI55391.1 lysophospholipid acyltransferase family protein [Palleronia sp. LCG004]
MKALQFLRSLIFNIQMYLAMIVIGIVCLPWALLDPGGARFACKLYCRWVIWTASWMVGLKVEIRGEVPSDEVLVAAKHQSFFDILVIFHALPRPKFIMKSELMYAPILGQYAYRLGCVPVDRGKRGKAIAQMLADVQRGLREPGQLCIYPQGTRIAVGTAAPYKSGTHALYAQLGQPCVPVATNVGVFWPKRGIMREPGIAVFEFMPRIETGLPKAAFMRELETRVEGASDRLNGEAGFGRIS